MRTHLVLHAIVLVCLGLGLISANCEGSGLASDCEPGELGCACGSFPECPLDENNQETLCCPDPLLYCAEGNICKSLGSSGGPTDTGDDGDGSTSGQSDTTTAGTDASGTSTSHASTSTGATDSTGSTSDATATGSSTDATTATGSTTTGTSTSGS